jgi:hypothetical protein
VHLGAAQLGGHRALGDPDPWQWNRIDAIWAAERHRISKRSAAASANSSGCARTVPTLPRSAGMSASSPLAHHARTYVL